MTYLLQRLTTGDSFAVITQAPDPITGYPLPTLHGYIESFGEGWNAHRLGIEDEWERLGLFDHPDSAARSVLP